MTELNPYAAPADNDASGPRHFQGASDAWQEDGLVVLPRDFGRLPGRCVRCNAPATSSLTTKLYWHHPALYVLIFFPGLLIYAIVAIIVRKTATVDLGLCEAHRGRRRLGIWVGWGGSILSFLLIFFGIGTEEAALLSLVGFLGLFVSIIAGLLMVQLVQPARIDHVAVRLKAGRPFVDSLPGSPQR